MASARIKVTGVLTGVFSFERPAYGGFGRMETVNIFKITGEDGTVYVWKTTASLCMEVPYIGKPGCHNFEDRNGNPVDYQIARKGDTVTFTASVKGMSEYKGEMQTEIQRVKVVEILDRPAKRAKDDKKAQKAAQLESIADGDRIIEMPYKQFKDHYADCETVIGSFRRDERNGNSYIEVIVRAGRMKASGVRGKHFAGYEIEWMENGKMAFTSYRAVCAENAIERAKKDFPGGENYHCRKIYF